MRRSANVAITVLALVLMAILVYAWFSLASKRTLPTTALSVHFVGAEAGRVGLTNATSKRLIVQFLAVQTKGTNGWIDVPLTVPPESIPPHEMVSKRINPAPSGEPWRLKMVAAEEITGGDRLVRASVAFLQEHWDRFRGRPVSPRPNAFASARRYSGHGTVIFSPVFE